MTFSEQPPEVPREDRPEDLPEQPNAADPHQVEKRVRRKRVQEYDHGVFVRSLLATIEGRRFLYSILSGSHAFETRFATGGYGFPIEQEIWFCAGQQDVGQGFYHAWTVIDPEGTVLMLRENDPRFAKKKFK